MKVKFELLNDKLSLACSIGCAVCDRRGCIQCEASYHLLNTSCVEACLPLYHTDNVQRKCIPLKCEIEVTPLWDAHDDLSDLQILKFKILGKGEVGCIPYINESWITNHQGEKLEIMHNVSYSDAPIFIIEIENIPILKSNLNFNLVIRVEDRYFTQSIPCFTSKACTNTTSPVCNLFDGCSGCNSDSDCSKFEENNVCDKETKTCLSQPTLNQIMENVAKTVIVTAAPMFLAGADPSLLWSLANLMQMFYYLLFFNIEYPHNLNEFLRIFSLGRLTFFQQPFSNLVPINDVPSLPSPPKFYENGLTGYFLESASAFLLLWMISMMVYLPAKLMKYLRLSTSGGILAKLADKVLDYYEWSGFLRLLLSSYFELMFACLLQIKTITYSRGWYIISSTLALFFMLINISLPIWTFLLIKHTKNNKQNISKFRALFEDFDINQPTKKYFIVIILSKKLLQTLGIVFFYEIPLLQILSSWIVNMVLLVLFMVYQPHHKMPLNILDILIECCFLGIHSLIVSIAFSDQTDFLDYHGRKNVGTIIITIIWFVLLIHIGLILKDQYETIKDLIKNITVYLKARKSLKGPKKQQKQAIRRPAHRRILRVNKRQMLST